MIANHNCSETQSLRGSNYLKPSNRKYTGYRKLAIEAYDNMHHRHGTGERNQLVLGKKKMACKAAMDYSALMVFLCFRIY
jgi:hypothetical protein